MYETTNTASIPTLRKQIVELEQELRQAQAAAQQAAHEATLARRSAADAWAFSKALFASSKPAANKP